MTSDIEFMKEALKEAEKGIGKTSPNPAVGAILVKNGKIVGRGYHHKAGRAHAEINALSEAGDEAQGATMYVTLEPCNHQGNTPACTDAIIEAKVTRVVAAREDPNPLVSGAGFARLKDAGISVEYGLMGEEMNKMNEMYEKFITTKRPFVIAKVALSADGKMAAADGSSKWISGEEAREAVQEIRSQVDAILVGINTILKDDPSLTCRLPGCNNPVRVVLDSKLRTPMDARVLDKQAETIIVTTNEAPMRNIEALRKTGVEVLVLDGRDKKISIKKVLGELASEEITSVLIEGGGQVLGSAFDEKVVDKIMFFIAPKIIGGAGPSILGAGISDITRAIDLERVVMKEIGDDYLLIGYPKWTA